MSTNSSAATPAAADTPVDRALDTPEFIRRLAEDLRVKSGSDLPLSCFVEQVKMRLKGRPAADLPRAASELVAKQAASHGQQTSELFKAWAMPE